MQRTSGILAIEGGSPATDTFIPVAKVPIDQDDIDRVTEVLRSGNLREGQICREFEERFAAHVGAEYAVATSSGSTALHAAYASLIEPGDEVLVPAFTFFATASMVVLAGGRPVFCDVNPKTFTLDVDDARRRITRNTKAVAPVHLFGTPCDIVGLTTLAKEHDLKVIWDAAQAHGTTFCDRDVGGLDDFSCYSFYPTKNMTTAEGGMITCNDEAANRWLRLFRSHGQTAKYHHVMFGVNFRLTDVMAALGIAQLAKLDNWVQTRRANARFLTKALAGIPCITLPIEQEGGRSSWHQYSILLDLRNINCDRDHFVSLLRAENVDAAVHYPLPLHLQPVFQEQSVSDSLPVSEALCNEILSLPVHPHLTADELEAVAVAVTKVAEYCMN